LTGHRKSTGPDFWTKLSNRQRAWTIARIVAVEPDEDNVALARETNGGDGITVLCAAPGRSS
jgi:hypothetical protein